MRALVFHNPTAGGSQVSEKELMAACRLAGFSAVYRSTKDGNVAKALKRSADIVVVAGGDGTVARILCEVAGRKLPVGIVPLGNANNIARSLGISGLPQELAETWSLGHTRPLNIGIANGPWGSRRFVEAVGVGPFASAIKNGTKDKKHGAANLRQGRAALRKALRESQPLDFRLKVSGRRFGGAALGVEITNIRFAGPALPIAPEIDAGERKLSIVWIREADRPRALSWIEAPQEGPPPFRALRGRTAAFAWREGPLRIDDEFVDGPADDGMVTVGPSDEAVNILVAPKLLTGRSGKTR